MTDESTIDGQNEEQGFQSFVEQFFTMSAEEFASVDANAREVMLFVLVRDMAAEMKVMSDIIASVGALTDKIGDKILELEDPAKRDALVQQFVQSLMGGMGGGMFG
jgi:hypothetical protein